MDQTNLQSPQSLQTNPISFKNILILLIFSLIIIILTASTTYFFIQSRQTPQTLVQQTIIPTQQPLSLPTKSLDQNQIMATEEWLVYQHNGLPNSGFNGTKGFKLFYPKSWKILSKNLVTEYPQRLEFFLSKSGTRLKIYQGIGESGGCLYPNDIDKEGMYGKYNEFKEFNKHGVIWRRAELKLSPHEYVVCQKTSSGEFAAWTDIGSISLLNSENQDILDEFDQILEKIEIINN